MSATMRAKLIVTSITPHNGMVNEEEVVVGETLNMSAVVKKEAYGDDGLDEDNTFASFTPSASFEAYINNPALIGKHIVGEKYYLDFTLAEAAPVQEEAEEVSAETDTGATEDTSDV